MSSLAPEQSRRVIPAQLGFLAIYNPSLGKTDESLEDQLVYYSSLEDRTRGRRRRRGDKSVSDAERRQDRNERLRNIGLAQGMVEFARSFSNGKPVDTVETHKARILIHELEDGWWILASINLTQIPTTYATPAAKGKPAEKKEIIEFSSREVKPPILLLGDLLRAHATFLLHNDSSLSSLFERLQRSKFISILERYWDMFLSTWNVLMHGNPANNLYGGIKLAACGELGVGVGEEERGSGEREALEGFTRHVDGLVDVIVSKFGDVNPAASPLGSPSKGKDLKDRSEPKQDVEPWLGTGDDPSADDGAIFLGVGTLSRKSVRDVTHWMEDLYRWGPHTYGVIDNYSTRKARKSKRKQSNHSAESSAGAKKGARQAETFRIPEVQTRSDSPPEQTPLTRIDPMPIDMELPDESRSNHKNSSSINQEVSINDSEISMGNRFVQYLTLGYGVPWSLGGSSPKAEGTEGTIEGANGSATKENPEEKDTLIFPRDDSVGHFLIGLMGDMERVGDHTLENTEYQFNPLNGAESYHERLQLRTLNVDLENIEGTEADVTTNLGDLTLEDPPPVSNLEPTKPSAASGNPGLRKTKKLRVVVYVNKPFIFTFLFEVSANCVASTQLYKTLHHQLKALVKPLLRSTKYRPTKPKVMATAADAKLPIYDLLYDPKSLTITSTIPNIPDPYLLAHARAKSSDPHPSSSSSWSRIEALNTHAQIINTYVAVHSDDRPRLELERTVKTGRGWWIVWTRVPDLDVVHNDRRRDPTASSISPTSDEPPSSYDADGNVSEDGSRSEQKSVADNDDHDGSSSGDKSGHSGETEKKKPTAGSVQHPFLEPYGGDKEIFLIRRASDNAESMNRAASLVSAVSGGRSEGWMGGTTRLAQGIGVDTRRYIEGLLNLNRQ